MPPRAWLRTINAGAKLELGAAGSDAFARPAELCGKISRVFGDNRQTNRPGNVAYGERRCYSGQRLLRQRPGETAAQRIDRGHHPIRIDRRQHNQLGGKISRTNAIIRLRSLFQNGVGVNASEAESVDAGAASRLCAKRSMAGSRY